VETQIEAVNELHKAGKVKRFGVSNFLAAEVEESVRIAKEKGWIAPSVYQGNYSAIARRQEQELFPVLRKHSIEFYAYSPIAGGFLSKSVDVLVNGGRGRWDPSTFMGKLYHALYNTPSMLAALKKWETLSEQSGIPKAELAYRWVVHNSALQAEYGDKVIIGPRNKQQLKETVAAVKKGPLPAEVTEKIEEIWTLVAADAPLDNFHDGVLKMSTEEVEEAKKRFLPTASKD
jgi:aryl-alcohol dehydrogenase-like predicted oxidoreductase